MASGDNITHVMFRNRRISDSTASSAKWLPLKMLHCFVMSSGTCRQIGSECGMNTTKKHADLRDASERIRNTSKETNRNRKCGGASSCRKCSSLYLPHWEAQGNPKLPALIVSQCLLYSHPVLVLGEPEVSLPLLLWLSRKQCPDPGLFCGFCEVAVSHRHLFVSMSGVMPDYLALCLFLCSVCPRRLLQLRCDLNCPRK